MLNGCLKMVSRHETPSTAKLREGPLAALNLMLIAMQVRSEPWPRKWPKVNQKQPSMVKQLVYSSSGSAPSSHWLGEKRPRTYIEKEVKTNTPRVYTYTSVVKGSRKASKEGAAGRGLGVKYFNSFPYDQMLKCK